MRIGKSHWFKWIFSTLLCLLMVVMAPMEILGQTTTDAYKREIFTWKNQRLNQLKEKDSWLSLAGLFWLKEGESSFGSGDTATFRIKDESLPALVGVFSLEKGKVAFDSKQNNLVLYDGKPIAYIEMKNDSGGEQTLLKCGTYSWFIIKRDDRLGVRVKNSNHPKLKSFKGIASYPIKAEWRIKAKLNYHKVPKTIETPTFLGTTIKQKSPGALGFYIKGTLYTLHPVGAGKDLFIVFGDKTNGSETYGGGRFITVKKPDKDGNTFIDFNKAFNPPCVFSKFATCPMPSAENILKVRITAGEKMVPH